MNVMKRTSRTPETSRKVRLLELAGAVVAAGGLAASIVSAGAAAATSSVVSTTQNSTYGTILVSGKTVYTLKASKVACTSRCLKIWPEVLLPKGVKAPTAGPGVNAASLGTVKVSGGSRQVTYAGKRLYWFVDDTAPGQVNGNITDKWGKWSVVVTAKPAHSTSSSGGTPTSSAGTGGVSF